MYILQLAICDGNSSVVIGCYNSMYIMKGAAKAHRDENNTKDNAYFYDYKEMNGDALWTNDQRAIFGHKNYG